MYAGPKKNVSSTCFKVFIVVRTGYGCSTTAGFRRYHRQGLCSGMWPGVAGEWRRNQARIESDNGILHRHSARSPPNNIHSPSSEASQIRRFRPSSVRESN